MKQQLREPKDTLLGRRIKLFLSLSVLTGSLPGRFRKAVYLFVNNSAGCNTSAASNLPQNLDLL